MLFLHHFPQKNEQNIAKKSKSSKFQEKPFTPPHQQKKAPISSLKNRIKSAPLFFNSTSQPHNRPFGPITDPADISEI